MIAPKDHLCQTVSIKTRKQCQFSVFPKHTFCYLFILTHTTEAQSEPHKARASKCADKRRHNMKGRRIIYSITAPSTTEYHDMLSSYLRERWKWKDYWKIIFEIHSKVTRQLYRTTRRSTCFNSHMNNYSPPCQENWRRAYVCNKDQDNKIVYGKTRSIMYDYIALSKEKY